MTSIAVVTAWKDHPELAQAYFAAVEPEHPDQLIIVDDYSEEPLEFACHRMDEPSGFCTANNAGLALVETDAVVMLNNDVVPLRPGWLNELRYAVEENVLLAPIRYDTHGDVDGEPYPYADGWYFAALTSDLRRLGGWNEAYDEVGPAYFSDNELTYRARMNGFTLRDHRPGVRHLSGRTGGMDRPTLEHALEVNGNLFRETVRADR